MNDFVLINLVFAALNLFFLVYGIIVLATGGDWSTESLALNGFAFLFSTVTAGILAD